MAWVRPLLLLLLLGTLDSGLVQGNDCNEGSQSVKEADILHEEEGEQTYEGYLKVKEDFKGIRLSVQGTTNAAWFPKESCFQNDDKWTEILALMQMKNYEITVTLRTSKCWKECTINSTLSGNLTIVAIGSVCFLKNQPSDTSKVENYFITQPDTVNSCEEPPLVTTTSTSGENTSNQQNTKSNNESGGKKLPWWVIVTAAGSIIVVVVSAVVCWKCMTSRNATNPPNELSGLDNSPRIMENDDVYETLDSSAIKNRSCEAIHWSSKDGLSPGQGEETYSTENELYESFSSYGHKLDQ